VGQDTNQQNRPAMSGHLDLLRAACARIEGRRRGTAYLISPRRAVTCEHVARGQARVPLHFSGGLRGAAVERADADADCALLRLDEPLRGVTPLPLGGSCAAGAPWRSAGYPAGAGRLPVLLSGVVSDPLGQDPRGSGALILLAAGAADGMGGQAQGLSGSPILLGGAVVGHLTRVLPDDEGDALRAPGGV